MTRKIWFGAVFFERGTALLLCEGCIAIMLEKDIIKSK